jgi:hypothetical protein
VKINRHKKVTQINIVSQNTGKQCFFSYQAETAQKSTKDYVRKINLFMQNEPNLCVFWAVSGDCEEKRTQNEPNSKPKRTQSKPKRTQFHPKQVEAGPAPTGLLGGGDPYGQASRNPQTGDPIQTQYKPNQSQKKPAFYFFLITFYFKIN